MRALTATSPLLANHRGEKLTRSGVSFLLQHYRRLASEAVPTLKRAGISPHTFRHYLPCRTMSGDTGQRSVPIGRFRSQRGWGADIARHSLLGFTGC